MLPIKRVVLFKHGVGYFQRSGEVSGDQLIELGFKASQMNDVLKSLTALDYGGGNFAALSYDSEEAKLRQKYVSSLAKEEERIEMLRHEVTGLKEKLERERDVLDNMVEELDLRG